MIRDTHVYTSPPIGSRGDVTHFSWSSGGSSVLVVCGCFRGSLEEFKWVVNKIHGNNQHGQDYRKLIVHVEKMIEELDIKLDAVEQASAKSKNKGA